MKPLTSIGRPSIDPEVMIRMLVILAHAFFKHAVPRVRSATTSFKAVVRNPESRSDVLLVTGAATQSSLEPVSEFARCVAYRTEAAVAH